MVNLLQRTEETRILAGPSVASMLVLCRLRDTGECRHHQWSETCGDTSRCRTTANGMTSAECFVCAITCSGTNGCPLQATRSLSAIQLPSIQLLSDVRSKASSGRTTPPQRWYHLVQSPHYPILRRLNGSAYSRSYLPTYPGTRIHSSTCASLTARSSL